MRQQFVEQEAVSIDGARIGNAAAQVRPANGNVPKVTPRWFARLRVDRADWTLRAAASVIVHFRQPY